MAISISAREKRRRTLGIDCVDRVVWKNWGPGHEYARKLVIKNVDVRSQTILYKLPERKTVFLTDYPEPVTLSSGMSFELEVRFCPTEVVEFHDVIEITVKGRGSFVVSLECLTPFVKMNAPTKHDFGFCAVSSTKMESIVIANAGTVPTEFYWEVPIPFAVSPSRGFLEPGESMSVGLSFTPDEACAMVCQAVCKMVGIEEVVCVVKLSGVGKYPYIRLVHEEEEALVDLAARSSKGMKPAALQPITITSGLLNFGEVLTGGVRTRSFTVENPSTVPATVSVRQLEDRRPCAFRLTPTTVVVPRGGRQQFVVHYKAAYSGVRSRNKFELRAQSGNSLTVETTGTATGPSVRASASYLDYGDVSLDQLPSAKERTRSVQLKNASEGEAAFQFLFTLPGAAFSVKPCVGVIPPRGSVMVQVRFNPTHPMNYLRRLVVLVRDAREALVIDVFGTAYTSQLRPLPFGVAEVDSFYHRLEQGLGCATPDELEALANGVAFPGRHSFTKTCALQPWDVGTSGEEARSPTASPPRRFTGQVSFQSVLRNPPPACPFAIDRTFLTFNHKTDVVLGVTVANPTRAAASAIWCVPTDSPFRICPEQQDIPAGSQAVFQVALQFPKSNGGPARSPQHGAQYIECYVNFKQMRSFRLVGDNSFTPPHCFTVQCYVNSDERGLSMGTSVVSLVDLASAVTFPACRVDGDAFQVLALENKGESTFVYDLKSLVIRDITEKTTDELEPLVSARNRTASVSSVNDHSSNEQLHDPQRIGSTVVGGSKTVDATFACFPPIGFLPPHQKALVLLRFSPPAYALYSGEATFVFNGAESDVSTVGLLGEGTIPEVEVEQGREIIFRPTCVTGVTRRELSLVNPTAVCVAYSLLPSPELNGVVHFEPTEGELLPGHRQVVSALFSPIEPRCYEGTVAIRLTDTVPSLSSMTTARHVDPAVLREPSGVSCVLTCAVRGDGVYGVVEVEPSLIDCGEVSGLQSQTVSITLYNSGVCDVCYEVRAKIRAQPKQWSHVSEAPLLRNHTGLLPGRSHAVVLITVQPSAGRTEYVLYVMIGGPGTSLASVPSPSTVEEAEQHPHCRLSICGTRPAIQVADVRSLTQQRSHLWRQLSINQINDVLAAPVLPMDVESTSFAFKESVAGLTPIVMDLGVGQQSAVPMTAVLLFESAGDCPVAFRFWLPTETDVHQELWFNEDEDLRDIQLLLERNLIEVSPRSGVIPVGETVRVSITYRFEEVAIHTLPVLLRVDGGKKVLLVLEGRTLPKMMTALDLHHPSVYELLPVALGDLEPPMQMITIGNPIEREVEYRVDMDALQQFANKHNGFPIFQCVSPAGILAPRSVAQMPWYFRPLEEQEYRLEVPISTSDGESYVLTLTGSGYHPHTTLAEVVRANIERAFLSLPPAPLLSLYPSLPIALSVDVLRLGAVPYFSLHRRTCSLENRHPTHSYDFEWDCRHSFGDHVISVEPAKGRLLPKQRVVCRVTMYSGSTSQLIEWPVMCLVTNCTQLEREVQQMQDSGVGVCNEGSLANMGSSFHQQPLSMASSPLQGFLDGNCRAASADGQRHFTRTTCTKAYCRPKGGKRLSVTVAPLESMSVRELMTRVDGARRQEHEAAAVFHTTRMISHDDVENDPVIWNALELLVQARPMPVEDYEMIYGTLAVQRAYFPLSGTFSDPPAPADRLSVLSSSVRAEDIAFVRDVLDELIRSVIALPRVQAAFMDPFVREVVYYDDMRARQMVPPPPNPRDDQPAVGPHEVACVASGYIGSVLEEALEQLVFEVVSEVSDTVLTA